MLHVQNTHSDLHQSIPSPSPQAPILSNLAWDVIQRFIFLWNISYICLTLTMSGRRLALTNVPSDPFSTFVTIVAATWPQGWLPRTMTKMNSESPIPGTRNCRTPTWITDRSWAAYTCVKNLKIWMHWVLVSTLAYIERSTFLQESKLEYIPPIAIQSPPVISTSSNY